MATCTSSTTVGGVLSPSTKLRRLSPKQFGRLVQILSLGNRWKDVAGRIVKPDTKNEPFYSVATLKQIEEQWKCNMNPAEVFLDHWSTSLASQPTVGDLVKILLDADLIQAAETISKEFLNDSLFPETLVDCKTDELVANLKEKQLEATDLWTMTEEGKHSSQENFNSAATPSTQEVSSMPLNQNGTESPKKPDVYDDPRNICAEQMGEMTHFKFTELARITNKFCDISVYDGGCKIGEGAFGTVYKAHLKGQWLAIKKLKGVVDKQFFNELEVLTRYKHENLLPLLGCSTDGPYCCLVYAYIKNGSLQERLACMGNTPPIPWKKRVSIAYYTACGINHLHTFGPKPLVHRDIKSANVLLDDQLVPKVGDFGLARIGSRGTASSVAFTSNVYGTSVYMAREAFSGEVSVKLDTFSYGVVLMELLTSLPPYDPTREGTDLISYMEENCYEVEDIVSMLDAKAGKWNHDIAVPLYNISKRCTETRKKDRPTIEEVLPELKKLLDLSEKQG